MLFLNEKLLEFSMKIERLWDQNGGFHPSVTYFESLVSKFMKVFIILRPKFQKFSPEI